MNKILTKMINNKIPKNFKSIKNEAKFWDNHDIGDFMGELKVVEGSYQPVDENKTPTFKMSKKNEENGLKALEEHRLGKTHEMGDVDEFFDSL